MSNLYNFTLKTPFVNDVPGIVIIWSSSISRSPFIFIGILTMFPSRLP